MSSLDKHVSANHLTTPANSGKKSVDLSNKNRINNEKQNPQLINNVNQQQIKTTPSQSLVNTNSNITINQPVLNNPVVNQTALNAVNTPQNTLNTDVKNTSNNQIQSTPAQGEFQGAKDLPAYAGIANMSLKSWVAQNNNNQGQSDINKTQLAGLFEAIKGFERKNYEEEFEGTSAKKIKDSKQARRKNLVLLSNIFSSMEQSGLQETELAVNISNFKKLGKKRKGHETLNEQELFELKSHPPVPTDADKQKINSDVKIKHLHELFTLPKEFPECLRLFASEYIEINPKYFKSFLLQRLKVTEEYSFVSENSLNKAIQSFVPLLNQSENQLLLPLLLLYLSSSSTSVKSKG